MQAKRPALADSRAVRYRKGQTILFVGEAPQAAFAVASGIVHGYTITRSGEKRTVCLLGAHDVLPIEWVAGISEVSLYYYVAITECTVAPLDGTDATGSLSMEQTSSLLRQAAGLTTHLASLQQSRAEDALLCILHFLTIRFGTQSRDGWHSIGIRVTHQDLATMTGHTRETITVNMARLKRRGIISSRQSFYYNVHMGLLLENQDLG